MNGSSFPHKKTRRSLYPFLFVFSFIVWIFSFWPFMSGRLGLFNDAISYFQSIKFLTDELMRFRLPLWNSMEYFGMPNSFFLLRISGWNPFYVIIVIMRWAGVPYLSAYLWFMAGYYFLGCLGFYVICRTTLHSRLAAFTGFLLLYFSALGTRIFDSYFILITTPLLWFAAFALLFFRNFNRRSFAGMIFALLLLLTTYVPFYAGIILFTGCILSASLYPIKVWGKAGSAAVFIRRHYVICLLAAATLFVAVLPAYHFSRRTAGQEIAMSHRHSGSESSDAAAVAYGTTAKWAVLEDLAFTRYLYEPGRIRFAVLYISPFIFILLGAGMWAGINKRRILVLTWAGLLFLLSVPQDVLVYKFLREHIPIFSYFRNLHFFLWWGILPLGIYFLSDLLSGVFRQFQEKRISSRWLLGYIYAVHITAALYFLRFYGAGLLYLIMCVMSAVFFTAYYFFRKGHPALPLILFAAVIIEPVAAYRALPAQYPIKGEVYREYGFSSVRRYQKAGPSAEKGKPATRKDLYVALAGVQDAYARVPPGIFYSYLEHRFLIYHDAVVLNDDSPDYYGRLRAVMAGDSSAAIIAPAAESVPEIDSRQKTLFPEPITGPSKRFRVREMTPNTVTMDINFPKDVFLVINEPFDPSWTGFLGRKRITVYRTNKAFMGVYVPEGRHRLVLRYGTISDRALHIIGIVLFYGWFLALSFLWVKNASRKKMDEG
ncbi:MAG: hypothetical protein ACLFPX_01865 [Candidatus Omnitrophota bacterium]